MKIKQYEVWIAGLNPRFGAEAGKARPVVIIQTDLLNEIMIDQLRAVDNKRLLKKIGELDQEQIDLIKTNVAIVLDL